MSLASWFTRAAHRIIGVLHPGRYRTTRSRGSTCPSGKTTGSSPMSNGRSGSTTSQTSTSDFYADLLQAYYVSTSTTPEERSYSMSTTPTGGTPGDSEPEEVFVVYIDIEKPPCQLLFPAEIHITRCLATEGRVSFRLVCIPTEKHTAGLTDCLQKIASQLTEQLCCKTATRYPPEKSLQTELIGGQMYDPELAKDPETSSSPALQDTSSTPGPSLQKKPTSG